MLGWEQGWQLECGMGAGSCVGGMQEQGMLPCALPLPSPVALSHCRALNAASSSC